MENLNLLQELDGKDIIVHNNSGLALGEMIPINNCQVEQTTNSIAIKSEEEGIYFPINMKMIHKIEEGIFGEFNIYSESEEYITIEII